jgi:hypothetical protein
MCQHVYTSGPMSGQQCPCKQKSGDYCWYHRRLKINQTEQVSLCQQTCKHIMKNGEKCPTKIKEGCEYCCRHRYHLKDKTVEKHDKENHSPVKIGRPKIRTEEDINNQINKASKNYYERHREKLLAERRVTYTMNRYPQLFKNRDDVQRYLDKQNQH